MVSICTVFVYIKVKIYYFTDSRFQFTIISENRAVYTFKAADVDVGYRKEMAKISSGLILKL